VESVEFGRKEDLGALLAHPVWNECEWVLAEDLGARMNPLRARREFRGELRTEIASRWVVLCEPCHEGSARLGVCLQLDLHPWEEADRGIEELPVEASVTGAEAPIPGNHALDANRKGWIRPPVRSDLFDEIEEDLSLTGGNAHLK
jgi:hypothetical protein